MFGPLETNAEELRNELILENDWETLFRWFEELPNIVQASVVLLSASQSDMITEI